MNCYDDTGSPLHTIQGILEHADTGLVRVPAELVGTTEAAEARRVSERTMRRRCKRLGIAIKVGKVWLVPAIAPALAPLARDKTGEATFTGEDAEPEQTGEVAFTGGDNELVKQPSPADAKLVKADAPTGEGGQARRRTLLLTRMPPESA